MYFFLNDGVGGLCIDIPPCSIIIFVLLIVLFYWRNKSYFPFPEIENYYEIKKRTTFCFFFGTRSHLMKWNKNNRFLISKSFLYWGGSIAQMFTCYLIYKNGVFFTTIDKIRYDTITAKWSVSSTVPFTCFVWSRNVNDEIGSETTA